MSWYPGHEQHGLAAELPGFPVEKAGLLKERRDAMFGQFRDIFLQDDHVIAARALSPGWLLRSQPEHFQLVGGETYREALLQFGRLY